MTEMAEIIPLLIIFNTKSHYNFMKLTVMNVNYVYFKMMKRNIGVISLLLTIMVINCKISINFMFIKNILHVVFDLQLCRMYVVH